MGLLYFNHNFLGPSGSFEALMGLLYLTLTSWNTLGHARLQWDCFTFTLNSWNTLGHAKTVTELLYLYFNFVGHSGSRQDLIGLL